MNLSAEVATVASPVFITLFIIALVTLSTATAVAITRRNNTKRLHGSSGLKLLPSGNNDQLTERSFSDIRVDDIVIVQGTDYLVEGTLSYYEAGHRWSMAHLVDGKDNCWFINGLDRSGNRTKSLLRTTQEIDVNDYPPEVLILENDRYQFDKRGTATVALRGNTAGLGGDASQLGTAHRCRWWNYHGPGERSLLVEQWGDDYRFLVGRSLSETDVEMMPGS